MMLKRYHNGRNTRLILIHNMNGTKWTYKIQPTAWQQTGRIPSFWSFIWQWLVLQFRGLVPYELQWFFIQKTAVGKKSVEIISLVDCVLEKCSLFSLKECDSFRSHATRGFGGNCCFCCLEQKLCWEELSWRSGTLLSQLGLGGLRAGGAPLIFCLKSL